MSKRLIAVALLCGSALSACVVAPARPGYAYGPGDAVIVDAPPPATYVEPVPPLPYVGAIWIGGYWGWRGGRHEWVRGRYEAPR
ncbi:MAG: hypothetical protein ABI364_09195 [Caldimonas sp.]